MEQVFSRPSLPTTYFSDFRGTDTLKTLFFVTIFIGAGCHFLSQCYRIFTARVIAPTSANTEAIKNEIRLNLLQVALLRQQQSEKIYVPNAADQIQKHLQNSVKQVDSLPASERCATIAEIVHCCVEAGKFELALQCGKKIQNVSESELYWLYQIYDEYIFKIPKEKSSEVKAVIDLILMQANSSAKKQWEEKSWTEKEFTNAVKFSSIDPNIRNFIEDFIKEEQDSVKRVRFWALYAIHSRQTNIQNVCINEMLSECRLLSDTYEAKAELSLKQLIIADFYFDIGEYKTALKFIEKANQMSDGVNSTSSDRQYEVPAELAKLILKFANLKENNKPNIVFPYGNGDANRLLPGACAAAYKISANYANSFNERQKNLNILNAIRRNKNISDRLTDLKSWLEHHKETLNDSSLNQPFKQILETAKTDIESYGKEYPIWKNSQFAELVKIARLANIELYITLNQGMLTPSQAIGLPSARIGNIISTANNRQQGIQNTQNSQQTQIKKDKIITGCKIGMLALTCIALPFAPRTVSTLYLGALTVNRIFPEVSLNRIFR